MKRQIPSSNPVELIIQPGDCQQDYTSDNGIFLLTGNATAGNVTRLVPGPGVKLPGPSSRLSNGGFTLTLYHFNDLHGQLVHLTPQGDSPVISRIAWQLTKHRQVIDNTPDQGVMLFSAGDDLIGSIFDELLLTTHEDSRIHASFHLNSVLGMDGACLGNHDFDLGLSMLKASIQTNAQYPILAANLFCPLLEKVCFPGAIYHVKGVRVGVIGLVTQAEQKLHEHDCLITDPLPVAKNMIQLLQPHCDVVIILSHLGYSLVNASVPMASVGDVELANSLPRGSVDLIIGGHSHHELNLEGLSARNVINGIPIVQSGSSGRFLGQVKLKVSTKDTAVFQAHLIPIETLPIKTTFEQNFVKPIVSKARQIFDQSLGITSQEDRTFEDLGTTGCDTGIIPMRNNLRVANFITDALVTRLSQSGTTVDLAMIDSSSVQQELPSGKPITYGDWFNVMPYADTLRIFSLTGQELLDLIIDNAKRVDLPNEPRIERGFLFFSKELQYTIVSTENRAKAQALNITFNGEPLIDLLDKQFRVVTTDFIRQYCKDWEQSEPQYQPDQVIDLRHHPYEETGLLLRRELVAYIQQVGSITEATGAICDDRIQIINHIQTNMDNLTMSEFSQHVSQQDHAMAGAVIATSAAQALALGQACLSISGNQQDEPTSEALSAMRTGLLELAEKDADAIAQQANLSKRSNNSNTMNERSGRDQLCDLPVRVVQIALEAVNILQDSRQIVAEKVQDDLEISICLLSGAIQAGLLLLDSNLRIWPDVDLHTKYQPVLTALRSQMNEIEVVTHIRPSM